MGWLNNLLLGTKGRFQKGANAYRKGDFETALKIWRPLAEKGLAEAQLNIGLIYGEGKGTKINRLEAYKWLFCASKQGIKEADRALTRLTKAMSEDELLQTKIALLKADEQGLENDVSNEYYHRSDGFDVVGKGAELIRQSKVSERSKIQAGVRILEQLPDSNEHNEVLALKYVNLGIAHKKLKDIDSSNVCFRLAIEYGHSTGFAYEQLAINLTKQGKTEEAIEVCESLINHPEIGGPRSSVTNEKMQNRMEKLQKRLAKNRSANI